VWGVDLFIYYALKYHRYGEVWTKWSYLELGGFAVLLLGSFTYYSVLKWPCFEYGDKKEEVKNLLVNEENNSV
jgi:hypothetical protein